MRIARVRLQRFRGFESADILFPGHTVVAGEPRAGRSDLIQALRRVLDPRSTRGRVIPLDIHRPGPTDDPVLTEVEVTLLDLSEDLQQLLSDSLEAFHPETVELAVGSGAGSAVLGVRLCYRAQYDDVSDTGDHWVDYPSKSDVASGTFRKVPRTDREAIPIMFIDAAPPLQVRAEGAFREIVEESNPAAFEITLTTLRDEIQDATQEFSKSAEVAGGVKAVLAAGAGDLLEIDDTVPFDFVPEDGTMASLLRSLQPAFQLDAAGALPIASHGSTTVGIFSASEAITAANARAGGLVVVGDDFGDALDASSAEHLALLLHKSASQVILTTRRQDVVRAFQVEQLLRLTRSHGSRLQHRLGPSDKAKRVVLRLALDQLLGALSARSVGLLEGPLDVEGYGALAGRLARSTGDRLHSFAANGIRLVAPPGTDGGIDRLEGLAKLAVELGFHVRAVVDSDKPGANDPQIEALLAISEQVIVLPTRTAVEGALIRGIDAGDLRAMVESLAEIGMPPLPTDLEDTDVASHLIASKILKKQGLHLGWVHALTKQPPIARKVIEALCGDELGRVDIDDGA